MTLIICGNSLRPLKKHETNIVCLQNIIPDPASIIMLTRTENIAKN